MSAALLPCGCDPLDVWDHAAEDRLSSHEQTCAYCQGVVGEYRTLAEPTRRWRNEPIAAPVALLERVMATVRSGLKARNYLPLVSPYGPVQLDTATAAAVLRWVVDQVDGARARSCRIDPVDMSPASDDLRPASSPDPVVAIRLTISARFGTHLEALAAQIRHVLSAVGRELLGLRVTSVDVDIVDLFEPTELSGGDIPDLPVRHRPDSLP